jgi:hypothetical protein
MFSIAKMEPAQMWRTRNAVSELRRRMNERAKKMITGWLEKKGVAVETDEAKRRARLAALRRRRLLGGGAERQQQELGGARPQGQAREQQQPPRREEQQQVAGWRRALLAAWQRLNRSLR